MLKRFTPVLLFLGVCWAIFLLNNLLWGGGLNQYGIVPRRLSALPAILWSPFLHGSLKHVTANTVPLLVLGCVLCARRPSEFWQVTLAGVVVGGALTWLFGRSGSHIGASGVVFCFFGYITSMAYFRRTFGALLLSTACLFAYGGMLRGILPGSSGVSWEGHLAGLITGVLLAAITCKRGGQGPAAADAGTASTVPDDAAARSRKAISDLKSWK